MAKKYIRPAHLKRADAAAKKAKRAAARKNGRCGVCIVGVPRPGLKCCDACAGRSEAARIAHRVLESWCDDCQAVGFHRDGCRRQNRMSVGNGAISMIAASRA